MPDFSRSERVTLCPIYQQSGTELPDTLLGYADSWQNARIAAELLPNAYVGKSGETGLRVGTMFFRLPMPVKMFTVEASVTPAG